MYSADLYKPMLHFASRPRGTPNFIDIIATRSLSHSEYYHVT